MADLHLNLKREYFDAIKAGTKLFEYRLASKWHKRIDRKTSPLFGEMPVEVLAIRVN